MPTSSNDNLLKLPSTLDRAAASGLLDTLRLRLEGSQTLRLDASGVEVLTFPCAQILLATLREHDRSGIERPSPAFASAFSDLGFDLREPAPDAVADDAKTDSTSAADIDPEQMDRNTMSKRILTIDDSRTIRDMLMLTLTEAGYEVLQGVDGEDGLNVLGDEVIDLVITDINMPKMDGYEVIRRLRGTAKHKSTPILVLTTESDTDKRNLAREAGATGWIVKPFDPDRLVATVRKVAC